MGFPIKRRSDDTQELILTPAWFLWSYHKDREIGGRKDNQLFPLLFICFPKKCQCRVTIWQGI